MKNPDAGGGGDDEWLRGDLARDAGRRPWARRGRRADLVAALAQPGTVELETINSADWAVERSGLINLGNPVAKEAGLVDGDEQIQVFFHVIRHPTKGTFIVDTGRGDGAARRAGEVGDERAGAQRHAHGEADGAPGPGRVGGEGGASSTASSSPTCTSITSPAWPTCRRARPVFTGPGEAKDSQFMYLFVRGSADQALEGKPALSEWQFTADAAGALRRRAGRLRGRLGVGALGARATRPGSTAYLVRTTKGPVLLTGDASHTRWGWEHHVEPGTFTGDAPRGVESFQKLQAFAAAHPEIEVRLGHQR